MLEDRETRRLRRKLRKLHSDLVQERNPLRARALMREHAATREKLAERLNTTEETTP